MGGVSGLGVCLQRSFNVIFCLVFVLSGDVRLASSGCVPNNCACTQQCTISAMGCLSIQTVYIWLLSYKNGSLGPKHVCFVCYVCLFFQFKYKVAVCHPGTFAVCSVQCVCVGGRIAVIYLH